ncbi:hypothetical protein M5K25_020455 [Dendrobium thyrsiflorum]|uniref:Uncharacterized protein n=1 Tax=Dendrobium thyrsiflorum TaxID=117978 RepID=A0ABD0U9Y4_DENTH
MSEDLTLYPSTARCSSSVSSSNPIIFAFPIIAILAGAGATFLTIPPLATPSRFSLFIASPFLETEGLRST